MSGKLVENEMSMKLVAWGTETWTLGMKYHAQSTKYLCLVWNETVWNKNSFHKVWNLCCIRVWKKFGRYEKKFKKYETNFRVWNCFWEYEKYFLGMKKNWLFENFQFHTLGYENIGCFFLILAAPVAVHYGLRNPTMHEYHGTQWSGSLTHAAGQVVSLTGSGTRTRAARSASNKLIRFHSPVDPPCWPSLPPVTRRNLNVLSARWDNVWDNRLYGCVLLFITAGPANTKLCVVVYYCSTYYKPVREGGGGEMEDTCYERLRAESVGPVRNPVL
jgi:hypothetical protein